jgi:hypothetical protein
MQKEARARCRMFERIVGSHCIGGTALVQQVPGQRALLREVRHFIEAD